MKTEEDSRTTEKDRKRQKKTEEDRRRQKNSVYIIWILYLVFRYHI